VDAQDAKTDVLITLSMVLFTPGNSLCKK